MVPRPVLALAQARSAVAQVWLPKVALGRPDDPAWAPLPSPHAGDEGRLCLPLHRKLAGAPRGPSGPGARGQACPADWRGPACCTRPEGQPHTLLACRARRWRQCCRNAPAASLTSPGEMSLCGPVDMLDPRDQKRHWLPNFQCRVSDSGVRCNCGPLVRRWSLRRPGPGRALASALGKTSPAPTLSSTGSRLRPRRIAQGSWKTPVSRFSRRTQAFSPDPSLNTGQQAAKQSDSREPCVRRARGLSNENGKNIFILFHAAHKALRCGGAEWKPGPG
ncbi:unnamed protein product [Lota lota]